VFGEWVIDREQDAVDAHRIAECLARVDDQVAVGSRIPAAAAQSLLATFFGKS
jgi:hypothetical protein